MSDYVSPYVSAAAARANYRAPLEMPLQIPHIRACSCCGKIPALEPRDFNGTSYTMIHCDSEACEVLEDGPHYAIGHTVREAADKWNALSVEAVASEPEAEIPDPQGDAMDRARDRWEEANDLERAGAGGLK